VDASPPQGLVGIDVADPGHDALVQDHPLDRAVAALDPAHDRGLVVGLFEGVRRDVADLVRHPVIGKVVEREPSEGPLVHEAQLGVAVGKGEARVEVLLVRGVGGLDEQLAAHTEVGEKSVDGRPTVAEDEPEVLATTTGLADLEPGDAFGEVDRAGDVASGHPGPGEGGGCDAASDHVVGETSPDDLDLGQLGHASGPLSRGRAGVRSTPRRRGARAGPATPGLRPAARRPSWCVRPRRRAPRPRRGPAR